MSKRQYTDINIPAIMDMDYNYKIQLLQEFSKAANTRIRALERDKLTAGNNAYRDVKQELLLEGRKYFYQGKQFASEASIDVELLRVMRFLNKKESMKKGAKKSREAHVKRLRTFASKMGIYMKNQEDEDNFFNFLNSNRFSNLIKTLDSKQVVEDFAAALELGIPVEKIERQYQNYLSKHTKIERTFRERKAKLRKKRKELIV